MPFRRDDRAQAMQLGAVLLFGMLVISFIMYQTTVVPNQNRKVEFNHFVSSQSDMEELRNEIIRLEDTGRSIPTGVQLGTRYPARLIAAQPPGSSGMLRTAPLDDEDGQITLTGAAANTSSICGIDTPTTRAIVYQPEYRYLNSIGNITYENTVIYTNGRPRGQSFQTDQHIVDGNTIRLYPLVGSSSNQGDGVATVMAYGGEVGKRESVSGGFTLTLPTQIPATQWRKMLSDEQSVRRVQPVEGEQAVDIEFVSGQDYDIKCIPVGIGNQPDNEPLVESKHRPGINPNAEDEVVLRGSKESSDDNLRNHQVQVVFENTDKNEYQNITHLRFPFFSQSYHGGTSGALPKSFEYRGSTELQPGSVAPERSTVIRRGGKWIQVTETPLPPGEEQTVTLDFYCGSSGSESSTYNLADGDFFVIRALFEQGQERTYFIALNDSAAPNGNRCGEDDGSNGNSGNSNNGRGNNNENNGNNGRGNNEGNNGNNGRGNDNENNGNK